MHVNLDPRLGTELAGYRLERLLGRGGMGVVYLAEDLRLKRRVALKLIAPELAGDSHFHERFLRESELAASFDHSHLVPVHAAGELEGQLWIAMRYVEGTDLKSLLREEGPLEPARALDLCAQVAGALDVAHARGLVHRDVKPANVLVTSEAGEEHCYLTDFGLARGAGSQAEPASASHLSGTVDYTAPEQILREPAEGRADVYSLACVLYECLAGEPPFSRPRPTATLFAHLEEPPPSLCERRPELPERIDSVLAKALAKDPEQRYETCGELVEAARALLAPTAGPWARAFRGLPILLALVGLLVLGAVLATVLLTRGREGPPAPKPILPLAGDSLVRIDPQTGRVVSALPAEVIPTYGVSVGEGAVWVGNADRQTLSQIDPKTATVVRTVDLSRASTATLDGVDAGAGAVWTGHRGPGIRSAIWRYDPRTGSFSRVAHGSIYTYILSVGEDGVLVTNYPEVDDLARLDPSTGRVLGTIPLLAKASSRSWAVGEGAIWLMRGDFPTVLQRIDLRTGAVVAKIDVGATIGEVAVGEGAVWVKNLGSDSVTRIDPATNAVTDSVRVSRNPDLIAVGEGFIWVTSARDGTVDRVDPKTLDVKHIDAGGVPTALAAGEGGVWVAVEAR